MRRYRILELDEGEFFPQVSGWVFWHFFYDARGERIWFTTIEHARSFVEMAEMDEVAERSCPRKYPRVIDYPVLLLALLLSSPAIAGFVHVETSPTGASIYLQTVKGGRLEDVAKLGVSPLTARLDEGEHLLAVTREGYVPKEVTVRVGPGVTKERVELERRTARLDVVADRFAGWHVLLDGKPTGETAPCSVRALPGRHVVSLARDGYRDYSVQHVVPEGVDESRIEIRVAPVQGKSRLMEVVRRARPAGRWTKADSGTLFDLRPDGTLTKTMLRGDGLRSGTWTVEADGSVRVTIPALCDEVLRFDAEGNLKSAGGWVLTRAREGER